MVKNKFNKLAALLKDSKLANTLWLLYKIAGYDEDWRKTIEEHAFNNPKPFSHWFGGKNRIYIPFNRPTESAEVEQPVRKWLDDRGYVVTDYIAGIAKNNQTNRIIRIGKLIQQEIDKLTKECQQLIKDNGMMPSYDSRMLEQKISNCKSVLNVFLNSKIRTSKKADALVICISQDPHDIAKMSYERDWTSCMELGSGEYHSNLFCEVASGGLVAYLIKDTDPDIERPFARVHIRRFNSLNSDAVIAKMEEQIYGNDVAGFKDAVEQWLELMNDRNQKPGVFVLSGGSYSDSFSPGTNLFLPKSSEELIDILKSEHQINNDKFSVWRVQDSIAHLMQDLYKKAQIYRIVNFQNLYHLYQDIFRRISFQHNCVEFDEKTWTVQFSTQDTANKVISMIQNAIKPKDLAGATLEIDFDYIQELFSLPAASNDHTEWFNILKEMYENRFKVEIIEVDYQEHIKNEAAAKLLELGGEQNYKAVYNYIRPLPKSEWPQIKVRYFERYPGNLAGDDFYHAPESIKINFINILDSKSNYGFHEARDKRDYLIEYNRDRILAEMAHGNVSDETIKALKSSLTLLRNSISDIHREHLQTVIEYKLPKLTELSPEMKSEAASYCLQASHYANELLLETVWSAVKNFYIADYLPNNAFSAIDDRKYISLGTIYHILRNYNEAYICEATAENNGFEHAKNLYKFFLEKNETLTDDMESYWYKVRGNAGLPSFFSYYLEEAEGTMGALLNWLNVLVGEFARKKSKG